MNTGSDYYLDRTGFVRELLSCYEDRIHDAKRQEKQKERSGQNRSEQAVLIFAKSVPDIEQRNKDREWVQDVAKLIRLGIQVLSSVPYETVNKQRPMGDHLFR